MQDFSLFQLMKRSAHDAESDPLRERPLPRPSGPLFPRPRLTLSVLRAPQHLIVLAAPPGCGRRSLMELIATEASSEGLPVSRLTAPSNPATFPESLSAGHPGPRLLLLSGTDNYNDADFATYVAPLLLTPSPNTRLVLSTCQLRSSPLRSAWLAGELRLIDANDLRFCEAEARHLLPADLNLAEARQLWAFTDGWAAGLRHIAPNAATGRLFCAPDAGSLPLPLPLADWFEAELCANMPAQTLKLLMDLSIFERFTPDLLHHLPPASPGAARHDFALLDPLLRGGVFLRRHPRSPDHFRLQPVFCSHLRERLRRYDPTRLRELREFALDWSTRVGNSGEMIRHALHLGDSARAARIIDQAGGISADLGDAPEQTGDLALPPGLAIEMPLLFLGQVYQRLRTGRLAEAAMLYNRGRRETSGFTRHNRPESRAEVMAWMMMLETMITTGSDRPLNDKLIDELRDSLQAYISSRPLVAIAVASLLAFAALEESKADVARSTCQLALRIRDDTVTQRVMVFVHLHKARAELACGRLGQALADLQDASAINQTDSHARSYETVSTELLQGVMQLEAGRLTEARNTLAAALPHLPEVFVFTRLLAEAFTAMTEATGEISGVDAGLKTLDAADDFAALHKLHRLSILLAVARARLLVGANRLSEARPIVEQLPSPQPDDSAYDDLVTFPAILVRGEYYLALGRINEARRELDKLPAARLAAQDQRLQIDLSLLAMRLHLSLRRFSGAQTEVENVLSLLARSGLLRRTRLALPTLLRATSQLEQHGRRLSPNHATHLSTFAATYPHVNAEPSAPAVTGQSNVLLSPRESEIIALIAEGLITKEIARRLMISEGTVKSHRKKIHEKLEVTSRSQAISKARQLLLI